MNELATSDMQTLALSEPELIKVLQNSLYPGAALNSIKLVIDYCKAARLDPLQKPVHIVPMWNRDAGGMVDVIMPGISLYRTQASRSGTFAGCSEPEFGPLITENIGGQSITYPEWCRIVVKKVIASGIVAEFVAREYWIENYAQKGGKEKSVAPNAMWTKRPRGQLAKCATAQALRLAFPEIASAPTAEEMEGKMIDMGRAVQTSPSSIAQAALPIPAERTEELQTIIGDLEFIAMEGGADSLADAWSGKSVLPCGVQLTTADRKALGVDELKRLKELAEPQNLENGNE